jgi:hypothetical protein
MKNASEWFQTVSQNSLENLSPLKRPKKKRKKHSQNLQASKPVEVRPLSSKWETVSSSFKKDTDMIKDNSLGAEESNLQNSKQVVPRLTKNKNEKPCKKDGQLTFHLKFHRDN